MLKMFEIYTFSFIQLFNETRNLEKQKSTWAKKEVAMSQTLQYFYFDTSYPHEKLWIMKKIDNLLITKKSLTLIVPITSFT